jgi:hypothetical protein
MKAETSPADLSSLDFSRAMQEFPDAQCCRGAQYRQLISSLPSSLDDMHRTCVVGRQSYARCGASLTKSRVKGRAMAGFSPLRAAAPTATEASPLGVLANLAGTWTGAGFNLIAVPNHQNNADFRLVLNATKYVLQFDPIGGVVPNRGSAQGDIGIFGLTYLQRVNDAQTHEGIHIEPGIWLNVPATTAPAAPPSIVRQSTIPHGDSVLAQGAGFTVRGGPQIAPVSSRPTGPGLSSKFPGYLDPYSHSNLPPGMKQTYVANMNQALLDALEGQEIINTTVLEVASIPLGAVANIPFVTVNANATRISAIFWIETVQRADRTQFLQLQYTQTVILNFLDIDWPHVSVATLIKT